MPAAAEIVPLGPVAFQTPIEVILPVVSQPEAVWQRCAPCQLEPVIASDGGTVSPRFSFWTLLAIGASQSNWELFEQFPVQAIWCSGERLIKSNQKDLRTIHLAPPQPLPLGREKSCNRTNKKCDCGPVHQQAGKHLNLTPSERSGNDLIMDSRQPHSSVSSPLMWLST